MVLLPFLLPGLRKGKEFRHRNSLLQHGYISRLLPLKANAQYLLGETKLICWSTGPTDPIISKNIIMALILANCLFFFRYIIFCFLKKKKNK